MQNQSGSFVRQQFVHLKILPWNHPKTLNATVSASDYSFFMVSTFSTQLYSITIFWSCHYKGSWTSTYMAQPLQFGSIINCQLRFMHNQQTKLVIVKLNTRVTHRWWGWYSSRLHLHKFGFSLFPSISAPYTQLPFQKDVRAYIICVRRVTVLTSFWQKHPGQRWSKRK
jgi:hypothetical protein